VDIIIKLQGGLGNQMFLWAFGKALSRKKGADVYFDDYEYCLNNPYRELELNKFKLNLLTKQPERKKQKLKKILRELVPTKKLKNKIDVEPRLVVENHIYEETTFCFEEKLFNIQPPAYLEGSFQSEKYFIGVEDEIRQGFELNIPLNNANSEMLEKIKSSNSISLHIRRGDYLKEADYRGICSVDYYKNAVELIVKEKNIENPSLFIFSDDYDWVTSNLQFNYKTNYVDINDTNSALFDLELMKNCKHNIVANSSFSWWGAWLNNNYDKMVVAPKPWLKGIPDYDLVPEGWLRIEGFSTEEKYLN